jgi:predicted molibdopterin-dependent oxidoreductase YjgC
VKKIALYIDDRYIETVEGNTVLNVAKQHGIYIPTLCYHPRTRQAGKCRMCIVEVERMPGLQISCSLPVRDGMVVHTKTERIIETRKMIIELLLANGKHNCITCEANGACDLQEVAYNLGIEQSSFPVHGREMPVDASCPMIIRDMNKCIQCYRCVHGCNRIVVNEVLDMGYRGSRMTVVCDTDKPMGESSCVVCGECVQLCPTGALTEKKAVGRGRAWDLKKTRTTCPYCGVGCQIDLHVRNNEIIKVTGAENVEPNFGTLCVKGRFGYDFVHSPHRLRTPLIRRNGRFEEASWDEALEYTAQRFLDIKEKHGPDSIVGIGCARSTNESNYVMMKFMRAVIGTNNVDHCART